MAITKASKLLKQTESCYISCGCNRTPHCMDWGHNNLICYGFSNSVAIYDPHDCGGRVLRTLNRHKHRINAVRWIRHSVPHLETEFVSVSTDKTAVVWTLTEGEFIATSVLTGHTSAVNAVDGIYLGQDITVEQPQAVIATASADSTIKLWYREQQGGSFELKETIDLGHGLSLCLSFTLFPRHSSPVLASGNDDSKIHLFLGKKKLGTLPGHEDWIRAVDFTTADDGSVLLVSGSQDTTVRIWSFKMAVPEDSADEEVFKQKEKNIILEGSEWKINLETVLSGHDGWIYSVHWHPKISRDEKWSQPGVVLTSSLDRTLVIWEPEAVSGVWLEKVRMGELGGNTLGFYGARFAPSGSCVLAHSYQGAFHMWISTQEGWRPGVTVGGHFDGVVDLAWDTTGRYLLSTSLDQTTRLHAPWIHHNTSKPTWHEMSRPQVHGYDMSCLSVIPGVGFASGSEEKVARVFTPPQNVLDNLSTLLNLPIENILKGVDKTVPMGAAVPALGLSNKAVFNETETVPNDGPKHPKDEFSDVSFSPHSLTEPGSEEYLVQNSLWPEEMKLYGHGYEVFCLAATHQGDLLASACKATSSQHAKILLWETKTWEKVNELPGHQLTVTQMEFSPDDSHLLSVSRDRRWCLFKRQEDGNYKLEAASTKTTGLHTRIIWCCSWTHDSEFFVTGSREGKVVMWNKSGVAQQTHELSDSITALCFARYSVIDTGYLLAVGTDSGIVNCYLCDHLGLWSKCYTLSDNVGHHMTVKKLAFRPHSGKSEDRETSSDDIIQLASCSLDFSVRVHNISLNSLRV